MQRNFRRRKKIEKVKESIKDINDRIDDVMKIFQSQLNNIIFDINDYVEKAFN